MRRAIATTLAALIVAGATLTPALAGAAARVPIRPVITSISPVFGSAAGRTAVDIKGSGFATGTNRSLVHFGHATVWARCFSPTECVAVAPAGRGTVGVALSVRHRSSRARGGCSLQLRHSGVGSDVDDQHRARTHVDDRKCGNIDPRKSRRHQSRPGGVRLGVRATVRRRVGQCRDPLACCFRRLGVRVERRRDQVRREHLPVRPPDLVFDVHDERIAGYDPEPVLWNAAESATTTGRAVPGGVCVGRIWSPGANVRCLHDHPVAAPAGESREIGCHQTPCGGRSCPASGTRPIAAPRNILLNTCPEREVAYRTQRGPQRPDP